MACIVHKYMWIVSRSIKTRGTVVLALSGIILLLCCGMVVRMNHYESMKGMALQDDEEAVYQQKTWKEVAHRRLALDTQGVRDSPWSQRTFEPHGLYGFVKYSGYRVDDRTMVAVGFGALVMWEHRKATFCRWTASDGAVTEGDLRPMYGTEHHDLQYQVLILWCHLKQPTAGGAGGTLTMDVDNERLTVYREQPGEFPEANPRAPYKHNVTHCSPPLHDRVVPERVKLWLDYHLAMGIDHFVLHDVGGISKELTDLIKPYLESGIVEVTPFHDVTKYESWYFGQVLLINDCVHRFRYDSLWVAYLDYDEFMWTPQANTTLTSVLAKYHYASFVEHGTVLWDTRTCLKSTGKSDARSLMERTVFREPHSFCRYPKFERKTCKHYYGHRKYFANPRAAGFLENHRPLFFAWPGVIPSTDEVLHQHLRGLVSPGWGHCKYEVEEGDEVEGKVKDRSLAQAIEALRNNPIKLEEFIGAKTSWEEHVGTSNSATD